MGELVRIGNMLPIPSGTESELDRKPQDEDFRAVLERLRQKPCRACGQMGDRCHCGQPAKPKVTTLEEMGVRAEHLLADLADFTPDVREFAELAITKPNRGALVTGSTGTGKSRLLAAVTSKLHAQGKRVRFYLARRLFARMSAVYGEGATELESRVVDDLSTCDLLAIDDLGHEGKPSEFVIGALHEIVDARHGNFLPTFVSTNLTLDEISRRYDGAIASRVGSWMPIVMVGEDRRLA